MHKNILHILVITYSVSTLLPWFENILMHYSVKYKMRWRHVISQVLFKISINIMLAYHANVISQIS